MKIWGMNFGSHDAALSVINHGELVFASHFERFSRIKDDGNLNRNMLEYAISEYGEPDRIYYYENHWKKRLRYVLSGQFEHIFEKTPRTVLAENGIQVPLRHVDHHYSHAAAGYYTSGFDDAVVVVVDAIGELETLTVWQGIGNDLEKIYSQGYPHSLGLFYSAMTQAAGFKPNGEEYIFMGMAAYGNGTDMAKTIDDALFVRESKTPLIRLKCNLHKGATMDSSDNAELAAASQKVYEKYLRLILGWAHKKTPSRNLVLMGGCAFNCVANSKIRQWNDWNNIWIMPNPGDAGSSLGSILAAEKMHIRWKGPYLGYEIPGRYPVVKLLSELKETGIAAVANGRAEFGPRALGNRSIFADPRIPDIKKRMNWLKLREQFRPFAAVIPEELAPDYFQMNGVSSSPYMQYVFECKDRNSFPGISHVDGTSRIQTVTAKQHPGLHALLISWYNETGCPMLVNTSLNIKNQPLVNDEKDAVEFQEKYGIPVFMA